MKKTKKTKVKMSVFLKKLPNRITIFRILLVFAFIPCVLEGRIEERMLYSWMALAIFVIASISDLLDGYIARKYDLITVFGQVMDPLADKIMVMAALLCFVQLEMVPAWMVIITISREFLISGIRIIAAQHGHIIAASNWGKAKTITEIITILVILLMIATYATLVHFRVKPDDIGEWAPEAIMLRMVPYWFMFIATVFSIISGMEYVFKNKRVFEKEL
jgi:CDP-diacylglycerol---glycerol-3-phosphate 3-phosphatidyltransferase